MTNPDRPSYWLEPAFTLTEIAKALNVPISTISHWLALANATGLNVCGPYSCADLLPLALLNSLRQAGWRTNADTVKAAFIFTGGADPRALGQGDVWTVYADNGTTVNVDAWFAFVLVRHIATYKFGLKATSPTKRKIQ